MDKIKSIKDRLPSTKKILSRAINDLLNEYSVLSLRELIEKIGTSKVAVEIEKRADSIYRSEEKKALKSYLVDKGLSDNEATKVVDLILHEKNLTKEISNIRRARAGKTAEEILIEILKAHNIPCEKGKSFEGYRPDVIVPSKHLLDVDIGKVIAIAVKRTLRERWAEDIDVFNKFPNGKFVLLTPDPDFNEEKAQDMVKRGMREVYIPDELYNQLPFIANYPQFKKLSTLPLEIKTFLGDKKFG